MAELSIIVRARNQASSVLRQVKNDIVGLDQAAATTNRGLGMMGKAVGVGLMAAAGVGVAGMAALGGAVAKSTSAAMDMEAQLSNIAAVMGKTQSDVAPLADLITELGLDPRLQVTATEAAAAIEMLARNGLTMDQILDGAAGATIALANATGGDFATSADVATDVLGQFGARAGDFTTIASRITGVVNNSKFTLDDFRLALAQAGGVAAASGVSFDDFVTTIAGISPLFASGSDAGTSFKTFLQRLIPQSDEAARTMRDLGLFSGLTNSEFRKLTEKIEDTRTEIANLDPTSANYAERLQQLRTRLKSLEDQLVAGNVAFFDAQGNLKSMDEIAGLLQDALSGLSEEQRNAALSTIFGTDAMRAAVAVAQMGDEGFQQLNKAISGTKVFDAAATRMDNAKGALEILGGVVETVQISIGNEFTPIVKEMSLALADFVSANQGRIVGFFRNVAQGLRSAIRFFQRFRLTSITSSEGFQRAMDLVNTIWDMVSPTLSDMRRSFATMVRGFARLGPKAQEMWTAAEPILSGLAKLVGAVVVGAFRVFGRAVAGVMRNLPRIIEPIIDQVTLFFQTLNIVWGNVVEAISALVKGDFRRAWQSVRRIIAAIKRYWVQTFENARDLVKAILTGLWDTIKSILEDLGVDMDEGLQTIQGYWDTAWGAMAEVGTTISDAIQTVRDKITEIRDWLQTLIIRNPFSGIVNALTTLTSKIQDARNALQAFADWVSGLNIPNPLSGLPIEAIKKLVPGLQFGTLFHQGGLALVGEAGPELVMLPRGSRVLSNPRSRALAGEMGGQVNVTINVQANVRADEDLVALGHRLGRIVERYAGGTP